MQISMMTCLLRTAARALATALSVAMAPAFAADENLIQPRSVIADHSLAGAQLAAQMLAGRRYDTFWNNGDAALEQVALAPDFVDRILPPGRPQGLSGPLLASTTVRAAIPDLRCEIRQMIAAGDRVVVHLHFSGHFSGRFKDVQGQGQPIDFIATDIYRVADGRIAENWHLEDNLTLLQQLGLIGK